MYAVITLQMPRLEAAVMPGENAGIRRESTCKLIIFL